VKKCSLIISILFLVITLANSLKIAGTIGYYALFTEDFIERLCENKDKPELQCDGKCALSKILLQESSDDTPPINLDLLKTETVLFLESSMQIDFSVKTDKSFTINEYANLYCFSLVHKEIHPPQV